MICNRMRSEGEADVSGDQKASPAGCPLAGRHSGRTPRARHRIAEIPYRIAVNPADACL